MWSNTLGEGFRITTFGESHGAAVGVVIDGVQPELSLDIAAIQDALDQRRPGRDRSFSPRKEKDRLEVISGLLEGRTTGAPLCLMVRNTDARPQDYEAFKEVFRPGHGDQGVLARYGIRDWRGGGRLSGRETVARVAAGAVAAQILAPLGLRIRARVVAIGGELVSDPPQGDVLDEAAWSRAALSPLRCHDPAAEKRMRAAIDAAQAAGDSVGGVVEVVAEGVPLGWGDPIFGKLDARLCGALMSIGAVKGVEVGQGFAAAAVRGSEHNDPLSGEGLRRNNAGGIVGGISNGAPIRLRVAVKPTPSVRVPQDGLRVDGQPVQVQARGRHDACICPRLVPIAEAMTALVLADAWAAVKATHGEALRLEDLRLEIDRNDAEIVRALARRLALAKTAGEIKQREGRSMIDEGREDQLREMWLGMAREYALDEDLALRLFALLNEASRRAQT
jgi:chorismate synthase